MFNFGKIGYDAYRATVNNLPEWENLSAEIQAAWESAAEAIIVASQSIEE